jgi:phage terminase small subunit
MRGRKPEPGSEDSLALQRANIKPGDASLDVRPPEELSPDAQRYWDAVVHELIRAGMFQQSDVYTVVELVETYAMATAYRRQWAALSQLEDGPVGDGAREARIGYIQFMGLFNKMAAEHGMTPAARLRLGLGQIQAATLMDALNQLPDR